jgi:predicted phosphoadenosine phosphosulfate sulfurtransferase
MMMTIKRELATDVLTAAKTRIRNLFSNGLPVYMSFSGGKDSLVLADVTAKLIQAGDIDPSQLRVQFIDEEAIFPCVEQIVKDWRTKFMLMGARFEWFCLEVKHFSCLNQLENDETFICWDRYKQDCWIRTPPPFAIRTHPKFEASKGHSKKHGPRVDSYQTFLSRIDDGPHMTGVRVAESIQTARCSAVARSGAATSRRSISRPTTRATVSSAIWRRSTAARRLARPTAATRPPAPASGASGRTTRISCCGRLSPTATTTRSTMPWWPATRSGVPCAR